MVPLAERAAMEALWRLEAKLFAIVIQRREVMLAQIKLAWWRDRLGQLAKEPSALPRGEPLLSELAQSWAGNAQVAALVDGYEAAMLAACPADLDDAAEKLVQAMSPLVQSLGAAPALKIWAAVRAGQMAPERALAEAAWGNALDCQKPIGGARALRTMERWAQLIARHNGTASPRAEAWLLFRAGLGF